jgi:hypothetical protein
MTLTGPPQGKDLAMIGRDTGILEEPEDTD